MCGYPESLRVVGCLLFVRLHTVRSLSAFLLFYFIGMINLDYNFGGVRRVAETTELSWL